MAGTHQGQWCHEYYSHSRPWGITAYRTYQIQAGWGPDAIIYQIDEQKPGHHLRNILEELQEDEVFIDHKIITPIHALKMVIRDTEDDLFSRVEQVATVSLSMLLTKPPSSEMAVLGPGSSKLCTAA